MNDEILKSEMEHQILYAEVGKFVVEFESFLSVVKNIFKSHTIKIMVKY
jgi:hypothetical protein